MTIQRMEHVSIVVDDLAAATAFFVELGLKLQGEREGDVVKHRCGDTRLVKREERWRHVLGPVRLAGPPIPNRNAVAPPRPATSRRTHYHDHAQRGRMKPG